MMDSTELLKNSKQRKFRAAGIVLFCVSLGLLLSRIGANLLSRALSGKMDEVTLEIVLDVVFTVAVQVVSLGLVPFLVYKLYLKEKPSEIFRQSNYRKVDWRIILCSFAIGFCAIFVTIFVSSIWQSLMIVIFGYTPSSSTVMPENFSVWHLLLSLVLTAVCPAIFEEFVNRGIALNVIRNSCGRFLTLLLAGVMFGLFHQHVLQVFYTMLMGILLAYLTLRTRSIWPAVVVHFTNNALSVIMDFLDTYSAFSPLEWIGNLMGNAYPAFILFVLLMAGIMVLMIMIIKL